MNNYVRYVIHRLPLIHRYLHIHCGVYIPRSHNRKYCNKDECQAARKRKKSSDYTKRKNEEGR